MSRFCRHNRFIERCPICRDTVPGLEPANKGSSRAAGSPRAASTSSSAAARRRAQGGRRNLRVYSDGAPRGEDDGYRCALVPGLHNSQEAQRLAQEIAFSCARLAILEESPPGLYAEVREQGSWERATWMCFLIAYLSPLQGDTPFLGIRKALRASGVARCPTGARRESCRTWGTVRWGRALRTTPPVARTRCGPTCSGPSGPVRRWAPSPGMPPGVRSGVLSGSSSGLRCRG